MQPRNTLDPSASLPEGEATSFDVRAGVNGATIAAPRLDLARIARIERLVVKVSAITIGLGAVAWYLVASAG